MLKIKNVVQLEVENLLALADYLLKLPTGYQEFDMAMYSSYRRPIQVRNVNSCGTAGCAIGHAPLLDLPINDPSNPNSAIYDSFASYSNVFAFGDNVFDFKLASQMYSDVSSFVWDFLFGSEWAIIDNTPQGAGKRILFLLANPVVIETIYDIDGEPASCNLYKMYSEAELTVEEVKGKLYNGN